MLNIVHSQSRIKCCKWNDGFYNVHIVIDNLECLFSYRCEDCNHYFLHCPLYTVECQNLLTVVTDVDLNPLLHDRASIGYITDVDIND